MPARVDRTGKRYGHLTCLERCADKDASGAYFWLCQCDCGETKKVSCGTLLDKKGARTCGCARKKPRPSSMKVDVNQQYGWLTTVTWQRVPANNRYIIVWECRCRCGEITRVVAEHLRSGATRSCGCLSIATTLTNKLRAATPDDIPPDMIKSVQLRRKIEKYLTITDLTRRML